MQPLEPCNSPYTMTLQAYSIMVNSVDSFPANHDYGTKSKDYSLVVQDYRLCYLQSMDTNANISQTDPSLGGFNSAVFEQYRRFKNSIDKSFPTVAFDKASFMMKISNAQDDYTFVSNNPIVNINEQDVVTFNPAVRTALPINVTLTATPKNIAAPDITYQFSVNEWARVIGVSIFANNVDINKVTDFTDLSICSGQQVDSINHPVYGERTKYIFATNEITNSADHVGAYYRDVDGTLLGEWGRLDNYKDSKWDSGLLIWTADPTDDMVYHYTVDQRLGKIGATQLNSLNAVLACRT